MTVLMSDLVATVRLRTDTVKSNFVTDDELVGYLNTGLASLHSLLTANGAEDRILKVAEFTITGADAVHRNNYFLLPSDFQAGRGVDMLVNGVWATLSPFSQPSRNLYNYPLIILPYGYVSAYYRIADDKCFIIPPSQANATFALWYIPRFSTLALSDPLPDYASLNSWVEYAIVDACIKVLQKQDLPGDSFAQQKEAERLRVLNDVSSRDQGPPHAMVNTRELRANNGWGGYNGGQGGW